MESLVDFTLKVLPLVAAVGAVFSAAGTLVTSMVALRAKRRAQEHLINAYRHQVESLSLKERSAQSLTKEEVEQLTRMIEDSISSMSKSDKHLVEQGLHQNSSEAVRNYIRDVAAAA
jgi:DNA replication protein DnaD